MVRVLQCVAFGSDWREVKVTMRCGQLPRPRNPYGLRKRAATYPNLARFEVGVGIPSVFFASPF
jgi:hypothetical protein